PISPGTVHFADTPRWKGAFGVQSDSDPTKLYTISYDDAGGFWVCSCPAGINRGECKHLKRYPDRVPTRAMAQRALEEADRDKQAWGDREKEQRRKAKEQAGGPTPPTRRTNRGMNPDATNYVKVSTWFSVDLPNDNGKPTTFGPGAIIMASRFEPPSLATLLERGVITYVSDAEAWDSFNQRKPKVKSPPFYKPQYQQPVRDKPTFEPSPQGARPPSIPGDL